MGRTKRGKLSFTQAAYELLARAGRPMHYRELTDLALAKKWILTNGKTPEQTMVSLLRAEIRRNGARARFVAKGLGLYALSRYAKRKRREM